MKGVKQFIAFCLVGGLGVLVNGLVYSFFSLFEFGRLVPLPFGMLRTITIAWGLGILAALISNFLLSKKWVFAH